MNPRTFELASSNAFQLVDARGPLRALFEHDEVVSFRDIAELRSLVTHYLAHDDERLAIAARARARALRFDFAPWVERHRELFGSLVES